MASFCKPDIPRIVGILNGCDTDRFSPVGRLHPEMKDLLRPIWLYVGRVSLEKNINALLDLAMDGKLEGTVVIVGGGTNLEAFKKKYSKECGCKTPVVFLGWQHGEQLEQVYRSGDVFVFPSLTDTFGQVQVEAMAS